MERVLLMAALLTAAAPAAAHMISISGSVAVDTINDPSASAGARIGDVEHYRAVFDPATLTDITAAANALYGGSGSNIRVASLADPGTRISIWFRGSHYTQDVSQGIDASGFGVAYPYVIYHGADFFGFDILSQRNDGFEVGLFGEEELSLDKPAVFEGGVNFCCGAGDAPFSGGFAASAATISAVPEPDGWTLLIAGFGLAGAVVRLREGLASTAGGRR